MVAANYSNPTPLLEIVPSITRRTLHPQTTPLCKGTSASLPFDAESLFFCTPYTAEVVYSA
jgi:hypothetical protein